MGDRLTRGFILSIIAGFFAAIWTLSNKFLLHFSNLAYADFSSVLIFGRKSKGIAEFIFAEVATYFWFGLLGIAFVYLITKVRSENLILKGWIFGVFNWFFAYSVTLLFKIRELVNINLASTFSHFIGASIYGIDWRSFY